MAMGEAMPDGWTAHTDPKSGNIFYHNAYTGETSWNRPQADVAVHQHGAAVTVVAASLPQGWTEHTDPGSGKTFYYNAGTGQTTWDRPSCPSALQPQGPTHAAEVAQTSDTVATSGALTLPSGWTEHADPASGRNFYHNASTGETTWERPQETFGKCLSEQQVAVNKTPSGHTHSGHPNFMSLLSLLAVFLDEVKGLQQEFSRAEDQVVSQVLVQYDAYMKQNAVETFQVVRTLAQQLLPSAQHGLPLCTIQLGSLNNAIQAVENRYGLSKSDTIPTNLLSAAAEPGSKLYPNLVRKVEAICSRTLEDLEKRERNALRAKLMKGGEHPALDVQRAELQERLQQSKLALCHTHAPALSQSDHIPVYKAVPVGGQSLSVMSWNVMEFPRMGKAKGDAITEGLVPLCDLVVKHLGRKEDRATLLEAMSSDPAIKEHTKYVLTVIQSALESGTQVVCLQELSGYMETQIRQLCRQKGWHYCFSEANDALHKCDAITAVISIYAFDEEEDVEFIESRKARHFASARVGCAWVMSCHVPLGHQTGEDQKQGVGVRLVKECSQKLFTSYTTLIVAGDWNADVRGINDKLRKNMPYHRQAVNVYTDDKTCFGAAFPADGIIVLH